MKFLIKINPIIKNISQKIILYYPIILKKNILIGKNNLDITKYFRII